jgi:hypothetical protein
MTIENGKVVIHAVHERDAEAFWKKLELGREEPCFVCGFPVTSKSFGAVGACKGKVVVCCDNGRCFMNFRDKINEEEKNLDRK